MLLRRLAGIRRSRIGRASLVAAPCLVLTLAGACGEGTVCFGVCDGTRDNQNITVSGNVDDTVPPVPVDPTDNVAIVVFVYSDLTKSTPPFEAGDFSDAEAAILSDMSTFSLSDIASGDLTVIFLLDETGDRQIDGCPDGATNCDEFAILEDPDGTLSNVRGGRTVNIQDVDITFAPGPDGGTATAFDIRVAAPASS
jgi:hypothetical protein